MDKRLNIEGLEEAMASKGLNKAKLAESLGISRTAVTNWFKGTNFPRPAELLKLGRLLGMKHNELVEKRSQRAEPLVAFRKRASCKTTDLDFERAKNMGVFLEQLVPYLDIDEFMAPGGLKNSSCEYGYIQSLVAKLRRELDIGEQESFDFTDLLELFQKHDAIIIPCLWGKKTKHENALHIHLPESKTTWIYLNLDVEVHDFKFWMAHEAGHILTIDLLEEGKLEEAENFADAFAGALLFPEPLAAKAYAEYAACERQIERLGILGEWANQHLISPYSVYKEMEKYAQSQGIEFKEVRGDVLHPYISTFNERFPDLSTHLFKGETPTANHFMREAQTTFETQIYKALGEYIEEKDPSVGVIATILGISPMDADAYKNAF